MEYSPKYTSSSCSSIPEKQGTQARNRQKTETDISPNKTDSIPSEPPGKPKEDIQMVNKHKQSCSTLLSLEKSNKSCKISSHTSWNCHPEKVYKQ